jgi:hypothetical protein
MVFFQKIADFFRNKVSNQNKPDHSTVTFDSEGNVINHPSNNPADGTPEEVKRQAKALYEKVKNLGK